MDRPVRIKDPAYLRWVRQQRCLICWGSADHAHHIMTAQPSAMGKRSGDQWAVPLCALHHRKIHEAGNENNWWALQGFDPHRWAAETWARWQEGEIDE
jgi:hypothetical protein